MSGEKDSFTLIQSPFIHHWNSELNVGVLERGRMYIGVCVLAAKEVTNGEDFIRKIGLDFKKDIQWKSASGLIEHLARSTPLLKVQFITTPDIPFELQPDLPENLEGRLRWAQRNHDFHDEKADSLRRQVTGYEQASGGWNYVPEQLTKQLEAEEQSANRFLGEIKSAEARIDEHLKPYYLLKDNVFAVALLFYIYTTIHDTFEAAAKEIIARKHSAKEEASHAYFVKLSDVVDPELVFSPSFPPFWKKVDKYYNLALAKDVDRFSADLEVGNVLRKIFSMAMQVKEGPIVEEKIVVPENLPRETPTSAYLGRVVTSVIQRQSSRQKVFFPLDTLTRHAIITGSSGEGKTYFAMHLAREASSHGIECLLIDPHGHFKLLPKRGNIRIAYVNDSDQIVAVLRQVYREAFNHPIMPGEPKLRKLVIIDEISAHKFDMRKIMPILNSCFSELRKFGYGFVIICTYATEERGISPTVRENAETYFVFRKKTLNELERIATLRHPNMKLIPYLKEGLFLLYSEDFCPEPFFVEVPRIDSLLSRKEVRAVGADDESTMITTMSTTEEKTEGSADSNSNNVLQVVAVNPAAVCKACGYKWQPRKPLERVKECPNCKTREWR